MQLVMRIVKALPRIALAGAVLALAVGIALRLSGQEPGARPADDAALPPPVAQPQDEPPVTVAVRFLDAWEAGRYRDMYALLSRTARKSVTESRFVKFYQDFARNGTVVGVSASVDRLALGSTAHRNAAQQAKRKEPAAAPGKRTAPAPLITEVIPIQTTIETAQIGRFSERNSLKLVQEGAAWKVDWAPDAVLKDLVLRSTLRVDGKDGTPQRGRLLDRDGNPLAWSEQVFRIGIVPGRINDEPQMLTTVAGMLGMEPKAVKALYDKMRSNWLIPVGELPEARRAEVDTRLRNLGGVQVDEVTVRRYRDPVLAGPALGLVGQITEWEAQTIKGKGYRAGGWVGRTGVEQWADLPLTGIRGGSLAIVAPDGGWVRLLAQQPQRTGKDVRLTLDSGVQRAAEDAAEGVGLKGALVVLDAATRQVLALVSRPSYNPGVAANNPQDERWRWGIQNPASEYAVRAATPYRLGPLADFLGLGNLETAAKTGLSGLLNAIGLTPPAQKERSAVTDAATPLQTATLVAALATDGRLLSPVLVTEALDHEGNTDHRYEPKEQGTLPLTPEQVAAVRKSLAELVTEPETLLASVFDGFPRPVAAADARAEETGGPSWFAGYAPADAPRYVVVAVAEGGADADTRVAQAARGVLERLGL